MPLYKLLKNLQKLVEKIRAFLFKSASKLRQHRQSNKKQLRKPQDIISPNNGKTQKAKRTESNLNSINLSGLTPSLLETTDLEKPHESSILCEYPLNLHIKNKEVIPSNTNKNSHEIDLETRSSLFPDIDYSQFDTSNPKFVSLLPCSTVP